MTADAVDALIESNGGAQGLLVRQRKGSPGWHDDRLVVELLDKDGLGNYLSKVADWRNVYYTKRGVEYEAVFPPTRVITDVLAERGWPLPPIERVVRTPVFSGGGTLIQERGYHQQARMRTGGAPLPRHGPGLTRRRRGSPGAAG